MHNKMKLLMENWRQYLNESDDTTKHILDALEKFKDYDRDEQLFALIDALLGIENPKYKDLKAVLRVLESNLVQADEDIRSMSQSDGQALEDAKKRREDALGKIYKLSRYLSYKNPDEAQHETFN